MRFDGFLRNLCIWWLIGGGYMTAREIMRDVPAGGAIGLGVAFGFLWGVFMALLLALTTGDVGELPSLLETIQTQGGRARMDVRERAELPVPPDQALALCQAAVRELPGVRGIKTGPAGVRARAKMNRESWGERIECSVQPARGGSVVSIRSRPLVSATVWDFGKNRRNVTQIQEFLAEHAAVPRLPATAAPEAEVPRPAGERAEAGRRED